MSSITTHEGSPQHNLDPKLIGVAAVAVIGGGAILLASQGNIGGEKSSQPITIGGGSNPSGLIEKTPAARPTLSQYIEATRVSTPTLSPVPSFTPLPEATAVPTKEPFPLQQDTLNFFSPKAGEKVNPESVKIGKIDLTRTENLNSQTFVNLIKMQTSNGIIASSILTDTVEMRKLLINLPPDAEDTFYTLGIPVQTPDGKQTIVYYGLALSKDGKAYLPSYFPDPKQEDASKLKATWGSIAPDGKGGYEYLVMDPATKKFIVPPPAEGSNPAVSPTPSEKAAEKAIATFTPVPTPPKNIEINNLAENLKIVNSQEYTTKDGSRFTLGVTKDITQRPQDPFSNLIIRSEFLKGTTKEQAIDGMGDLLTAFHFSAWLESKSSDNSKMTLEDLKRSFQEYKELVRKGGGQYTINSWVQGSNIDMVNSIVNPMNSRMILTDSAGGLVVRAQEPRLSTRVEVDNNGFVTFFLQLNLNHVDGSLTEPQQAGLLREAMLDVLANYPMLTAQGDYSRSGADKWKRSHPETVPLRQMGQDLVRIPGEKQMIELVP